MRTERDLDYFECKESAEAHFYPMQRGWTAEECRNWMTEEDNDDNLVGANLAIWHLAIGEYEVRNNFLEDIVHRALWFFVPKLESGEYDTELRKDEIEAIREDCRFIRSKIKLRNEQCSVD